MIIIEKDKTLLEENLNILAGCGCSGTGSGGCIKDNVLDDTFRQKVFSAKQLGRVDASCVK